MASGKPWSADHDQYLVDHYLSLTQREIAAHLGRTHAAVQARVKVLGLKKNKPITDKTAYSRHKCREHYARYADRYKAKYRDKYKAKTKNSSSRGAELLTAEQQAIKIKEYHRAYAVFRRTNNKTPLDEWRQKWNAIKRR